MNYLAIKGVTGPNYYKLVFTYIPRVRFQNVFPFSRTGFLTITLHLRSTFYIYHIFVDVIYVKYTKHISKHIMQNS